MVSLPFLNQFVSTERYIALFPLHTQAMEEGGGVVW